MAQMGADYSVLKSANICVICGELPNFSNWTIQEDRRLQAPDRVIRLIRGSGFWRVAGGDFCRRWRRLAQIVSI
jgi:hypothetical protein